MEIEEDVEEEDNAANTPMEKCHGTMRRRIWNQLVEILKEERSGTRSSLK